MPHTIDEMAADAVHFIRALGHDRADLLGFSLGGGVAQVITLKHPELVHRVIPAGNSAAAILRSSRELAGAESELGVALRRASRALAFLRAS